MTTQDSATRVRASVEHRCFPQPEDRNQKVWRYFKANYLVQLLRTGNLMFTRSDLLGDPCEGSRPAGDAETYRAAEHEVTSRGDEKFMPKLRASWRREDEHARRALFISCWQMSQTERMSMWERYCRPKELGVAILSTYARLDSAVPLFVFGNRPIMLGLVTYGDYQSFSFKSDPSNMYSTFMMKKVEYSDEEEVRFVLDMSRKVGAERVGVKVDVAKLVESIVFSPYVTNAVFRGFESVIRKIGYKFPISQSQIHGTTAPY